MPDPPAKAVTAPGSDFKYSAFLSYSHADEAWARWLQNALETYRVPARIAGGLRSAGGIVPRRLAPVFRDRSDLSSSPDLSENICQALAGSECLIVICSPAAVASRWVNDEIDTFVGLGRSQHIHCLIVAGEPHAPNTAQGSAAECFPPALCSTRNADGRRIARHFEPTAADARPGRDGKGNAKLKLLAALLGVDFDQLRQRDQRRHARRLMWVTGAALLITLLTTTLAIEAWIGRRTAVQERQAAERRRKQAENLVDFMLGDLNDKLRQVQRLDILEAVDNRADEYFKTLPPRDQTDQSLAQRVRSLQRIGRVRADQGRLPAAINSYQGASTLAAELMRRAPDDSERRAAYAETLNFLGNAYWFQGDTMQAGENFRHAVELLEAADGDGASDERRLALASARTNLGRVFESRGNYEAARQLYEAVRKTFERLIARDATNGPWQTHMADADDSLGKLALAEGRLATAIEAYWNVRQIRAALWSRTPSNRTLQENLLVSDAILGRALQLCGAEDAAARYVHEAVSNAQDLVAYDTSQVDWREELGDYTRLLAGFSRRSGQLPLARTQLTEALRLLEGLATTDPTNVTWRREVAIAQIEQGRLALASGDLPAAHSVLRRALPVVEPATAVAPGDATTALSAAQAHILLGQTAWREGDRERARTQWLQADTLLAAHTTHDADPNLLATQATALVLLDDPRAQALIDRLAVIGFETPDFRRELFQKGRRYPSGTVESRCGIHALKMSAARPIR